MSSDRPPWFGPRPQQSLAPASIAQAIGVRQFVGRHCFPLGLAAAAASRQYRYRAWRADGGGRRWFAAGLVPR
jgi:hypothetical protein